MAAAKHPSPRPEAQWIAEDALGISAGKLALGLDKEVPENTLASARHFLRRRCAGEPLQYVLGHCSFRKLDLKVGPGVLVPRPETELLVDMVIKLAPPGGTACELGVGSGALSLAVAQERPDLFVLGIELSPDALAYAERNRIEAGLKNVAFIRGDLFSACSRTQNFSLIAANLPYVSEAEMKLLPEDVRLHEPELALYGGADGLDIIRQAVHEAPDFLLPKGHLLLEMGETQGAALFKLLSESNSFEDILICRDLCGRERFIQARKR